MKKAFTLLELVVVIIILGVLATLGLTQYGSMVERARGAEAKQILGDCRKLAAAYRLANGTVNGMTNADVNIGTAADQIPSSCRPTHYFYYDASWVADPVIIACACRCTSGGKDPQGNISANPTEQWDLCWQINLLDGTVTSYKGTGRY